MADFLTNLWDSVFTPGTTPTLLLATNATFAFLQLTLAALLAATFSIHFVILSILCGGLWWSINWFADEVRQAQEKEEEAKRNRVGGAEGEDEDRNSDSADDEGGDTVTEDPNTKSVEFTPTPEDNAIRESVIDDIRKQGRATEGGETSALHVPDEIKHRKTSSEASGDVSTDSEWEKVDR